jgi:HAD superfamily hydrolase (TIGR01509 family)
MTPDLVIFDCDGVLIDSEVISARVLVELAAEAGILFDVAHVAAHFLGRSFPTVARAIAETWGPLPPGFEAEYRARLLRRFEGELRPTPGAADALRLCSVPSCVATSSSPERARRSLAIAGLAPLVGRVFTASEVSRGKPAPDLFLHAAREMGASPARCLVIEDSAPGLRAAEAAGMASAFFAGGSHLAAGRGGGFDMAPPVRAFPDWAALARAHPVLAGARGGSSEGALGKALEARQGGG